MTRQFKLLNIYLENTFSLEMFGPVFPSWFVVFHVASLHNGCTPLVYIEQLNERFVRQT